MVQVVTTEVPVYVDKLVVKEVEKIVTKEVVVEDETPLIEFKSEKTKSQRSGTLFRTPILPRGYRLCRFTDSRA